MQLHHKACRTWHTSCTTGPVHSNTLCVHFYQVYQSYLHSILLGVIAKTRENMPAGLRATGVLAWSCTRRPIDSRMELHHRTHTKSHSYSGKGRLLQREPDQSSSSKTRLLLAACVCLYMCVCVCFPQPRRQCDFCLKTYLDKYTVQRYRKPKERETEGEWESK